MIAELTRRIKLVPFSRTRVQAVNMFSSNSQKVQQYLVTVQIAKDFVQRAMVAVGSQQSHASDLADVLVMADMRGHYSHGVNRLEKYVQEVRSRACDPKAEPFVDKETVSTAVINGNNALGCVVGNFAMKKAMEKARETGVGWVVAHGSNHYGIAGHYSLQASDQGLMGFCFTNTSPFQVPTRSRQRILGTNPISCAAPSTDPNDEFCLDMATSAVAQGKIEVQKRKGADMPVGWGTNSKGLTSTDPVECLESGGMLSLGGHEETSGYKGYGLALMVEILCGGLSGSRYATNIRTWDKNDKTSDLGQCFIAVDPEAFAPGFKERVSDLMRICRSSEKAEGVTDDILVAGDPERINMAKVKKDGGILYHPNFISYLDELAEECKISKIERSLFQER